MSRPGAPSADRCAPAARRSCSSSTSRRGDIALIDHLDIDRVSAEELIAAGAVAVLNCRPSSSGSYPNLGPQLLVEAGVLLVDLPDDSLFEVLSDGEAITACATARCSRDGEVLARGEVLDLARVRAETEARRREIGEALERFAHNTIEHMREERELLAGQDRAAALRHRLPRPLDARGRSRRRSPARPARPAAVHPRHAPRADRRRRRRRGAAARRACART